MTSGDPRAGLTVRVVSGVAWNYLSVIVTTVLQLVVTALLARLVEPSAFGLIAMAMLVLRFGQYFAQFGLGQAVVQAREIDESSVSAAFITSTTLGVLASVVVVLAAPMIAAAFANPGVVPVLRWMSLTFVLSGLSVASLAMLRRELRFRAIALMEMSSYVIGYALVGITVAVLGKGVWALVAASLSQSLLSTIVLLSVAKHPPVVAGWRDGLRRLAGFGSRVSLLGFLEFLASNLDTIAVGRLLGDRQLGFYNRGMSLANLPAQQLTSGLSRVLLPSFAQRQDQVDRVRDAHRRVTLVYAAVTLPISLGMAAGAPTIVAVLLGPKWVPVVPVLAITAMVAPLTTLTHFTEVVCEALALLRLKLLLRLGQIATFVVLLSALSRYGLLGFAAAFALSEFLMWLAYLVVASNVMSYSTVQLLSAYVPGLIGGLATAAVISLGEWLLVSTGVSAIPRLAVLLGLGATVLGVSVLRLQQGMVWREVRSVTGQSSGLMARVVRVLDRVSAA